MLLGITRRWGWRSWLVLFLFGLWNRETALFLPLWLLIDALVPSPESNAQRARTQLGAALGLAVIGTAFVVWIRRALFQRRLEPAVDPLDAAHSTIANHVMLIRNLREFWSELAMLARGPAGRARFIAALMMAGAAASMLLATRLTLQGRKVLAWSLTAIACVVTFGAISEGRIWIGFIPLVLFWLAVFSGHARSLRFIRPLR
jgi:hypothetical protein